MNPEDTAKTILADQAKIEATVKALKTSSAMMTAGFGVLLASAISSSRALQKLNAVLNEGPPLT